MGVPQREQQPPRLVGLFEIPSGLEPVKPLPARGPRRRTRRAPASRNARVFLARDATGCDIVGGMRLDLFGPK